MKSLALSLICLRTIAAVTEYSDFQPSFEAYNLEPDRLTEKSSFLPRSRARLMDDDVDNDDIDSWMEGEVFHDDGPASSLLASRIPKNQLALHLVGSAQTSEYDGTLNINSPEPLPNTPEEPYGRRFRYYGPKEKESVKPLDKKLLKKTGTTIAGCCVGQHVVLAADTRATEGTMVADKRCQKLHLLAKNAWCAGAGTSADLDHLTKECLFAMSLQTLTDKSIGNANSVDELSSENDEGLIFVGKVSIDHLCRFFQDRLFRAKGNLGANLILGGVYDGKAHLRALHPHGSMDIDLPFTALGSGGLAAMGVLEEGYSKIKSVQDGIKLCERAILAGIKNDLGSGSQVDVCVIYPDGSSKMTRCTVPEEELSNDDLEHLGQTTSVLDRESSPTAGVNGFGNLPFAIESKRTLFVRDDEATRIRAQQWNKILGIGIEDKQQ